MNEETQGSRQVGSEECFKGFRKRSETSIERVIHLSKIRQYCMKNFKSKR
jgi:hypothetical protein